MTRVRRSTDEVRAAILRHAAEEFSATGYPQTTMRTVAARAGVSLSVLYRHFENKDALFTAAVVAPFTEFLQQFATAWRGQLDRPLDDARLVREFVRDFRTALEPRRDAVVALVALHEVPNALVVEALRRSIAEVVADVSRIAEHEAVRRDRGPERSLQRVSLVISLLVGEMLMRPWLPEIRTGTDPSQEQDDALTRLLLHGLRLDPTSPEFPAVG